MPIDPQRAIPIYLQLKEQLIDDIALGRYGPADRLPTEHELCERYGISRTPVTRALAELAGDGVLTRRRGVGTFVNPEWLRRAASGSELRITVQEGPWADLVREVQPEHPPIALSTIPRPQMHEALERAVAQGRAPDLAIFDSVWVPEFAQAGFLWPLEELDETWVRLEHETDFLEPLVAANRYDGRTYGAVIYATVSGLWYARREFERLGLAAPTTWAELTKTAQAIAGDSPIEHPIVMTGGRAGGETTTFLLIGCLASNGAGVFGPDGVAVDSRETVGTLRFLRGLVDDGLMSDEVVDYGWDQPARLLAAGRAAMSLGGSYEAPMLAEALGVPVARLPEEAGFISFPAGPRGHPASAAGGMSCCVFRQTQHPHAAMRMLERVVSTDALSRPGRTAGRIPARRSAIARLTPRLPYLAETAAMFNGAVNQPATPSYPRVSLQLQAMVEAVLTGRRSAPAAARQARELIEAIAGRMTTSATAPM